MAAKRRDRQMRTRIEKALEEGLLRATEIPSRSARCAAEALEALESLRPIIPPNVPSDLKVGMDMLRSCLKGAIENMRVNLAGLQDADTRARYESMIAAWEPKAGGK